MTNKAIECEIRKVYKYELNLYRSNLFYLQLPEGAEFLHAGPEPSEPDNSIKVCLWFLVNPENTVVSREFYVYGTGHPIEYKRNDCRKYLGSVIIKPYAWHVFERDFTNSEGD